MPDPENPTEAEGPVQAENIETPTPVCEAMSACAVTFQRTEQRAIEDGVMVRGIGADPNATIVDSNGDPVDEVHSFNEIPMEGCFNRKVDAPFVP